MKKGSEDAGKDARRRKNREQESGNQTIIVNLN
jgi:hypothetical protein